MPRKIAFILRFYFIKIMEFSIEYELVNLHNV